MRVHKPWTKFFLGVLAACVAGGVKEGLDDVSDTSDIGATCLGGVVGAGLWRLRIEF